MTALRKRFLRANWVDTIRSKLLRLYQSVDNCFDTWVESLETTNALLLNTTAVFSNSRLREHIELHAVEDLRTFAESSTISEITNFQEFKYKLSEADSKRRRERAQRKHELESFLSARARPQSTSLYSRIPPGVGTPLNSGPAAGANANTRRALPKLTEGERKLLSENKGCLKCRKVNAGHFAKECPVGFPNPATYRNLVTGRNTVAAIVEATPQAQDHDNDFVEIPPIAAIHGVNALSSCVLSSGDDSWSSDNEYVNHPLSLPHIVWNARLHSPSGISDPLAMLTDSGSTTVLIHEDVVTNLNLCCRQLHTPFNYKAAFGSEIRSSREWVKLRISNADLSWSSISVHAVIVPDLCSPVILGLPFFHRNALLVDPEASTVIEKSSGRDVIAPGKPCIPDDRTDRRRLADLRKEKRQQQILAQEQYILEDMLLHTTRKDVICEMQLNFGESSTPNTAAQHIHELSTDDIVAAIQQRVDELDMLAVLARENAEMRHCFDDCFPSDIPHLNELPTDVYHRFRLVDPNMVIARRQYECPKKYREAWKTLLEQHLAAGRLRPSSSPYASPAFLIPKTDRAVLPHWVNDYRKLNSNTIPDVHPLPSIAEILSDCGNGKFFAKIDMTNSFFQTRVHPDDVPLTAVTMPFGLYEWTIMPQGCRNAPATHQR
ncbi:hypothetical protein PHLCEN_2v9954 [Hermanssonia centrifuga]|uniref:Reverse transcriptase domain-containing protein n=1 Tax=Hermanssonia centrifuga TaxID=98765 RepID=A0A2R6NP91_9APHY|nr:hypothetical protein PHLCEN_2v9954 [Hermanssonia centrifuga]